MSSIGKKDGILDGLVELFMEEELFPAPASLDWLAANCEVFGRLKSSNTSARRGWWKWMYVAEESLDWD